MSRARRDDATSWMIGAGLALAAHAGAGLALWGGGQSESASGGAPPIMIATTAPQSGVEAPATDAAPGDLQRAGRPREAAGIQIEAPLAADGAFAPTTDARTDPTEVAEQGEAETVAPQAAAGPVHGARADSSAGGAVVDYQSRLRAHLERNKRYPRAARAHRQEGVVLVVFSMRRDGTVISARIAGSSGHALLDREVLVLIERAQPMPIPPEALPGAVLEFTAPVEFYLRS